MYGKMATSAVRLLRLGWESVGVFRAVGMLWLLSTPLLSLAAFVDVSSDRLAGVPDTTYQVVAGDVDGDGALDVVVANNGQTRLLHNTGRGSFSDVTASRLPIIHAAITAVVLADVDGDGDLDLLLANASGANRLWLNDGQGMFTDATVGRWPTGNQVSMDLQAGDVDGDGDVDIVVANRNSRNRLWRNDGTGVFTDVTTTALPVEQESSVSVALVDVDGNGTLDIVVANQQAPLRLWLNNGLGVFHDVSSTQLPAVTLPGLDVTAADVDGDGDQDLLVAAGTAGLYLLHNDGQGTFSDVSATHLPPIEAFGIKVLVGDIDEDGRPDLVLTAAGQDRLFRNDGSGHFDDATDTWLPADSRRSFGGALFDADNDLDLDLLLATPGGLNRLLFNAAAFPRIRLKAIPAYIAVGTPVTLTIKAFDEDGLASATLLLTDPAGGMAEVDLSLEIVTGQVTHGFTPTLAGVYTATVTVQDATAVSHTRHTTILVQPTDTTAPQVNLLLEAPAPLFVGQSVTIHLTALDDQDVVSTVLTVNDVAVPLPVDGTVTFVATGPGLHTVEAQASDAAGNVGSANTTFVVEADTAAPVVQVTATPSVVAVGQSLMLTVHATDNIRVTSTTLAVSGPAMPDGLDLPLDVAGQATYRPFQPGTYTALATAHDLAANVSTATAAFMAEGSADTTPPVVTLTVQPLTVVAGQPVTLQVTASDNIGVTALMLEINGVSVALDTTGIAVYTPPIPWEYTAVALAWDALGNAGSAEVLFRAIDPAHDTTPPVIAITAPTADADITAPTVIRGTVQDITLVSYTLASSPHDQERWTIFATGTTEVVDNALGTFDPTLLPNDLYDIRLTAVDGQGWQSFLTTQYLVTGHLKVGHFSVTFRDLAMPSAGLPLILTRTYDSRESATGDFGVGWQLGFQTLRLRENRLLGLDWVQTSTGGPFPLYCLQAPGAHYVSIFLPDGRTEVFDLTITPQCQALAPIAFATATFTSRAGNASKLEALADNTVQIVGFLGEVELLHFDAGGNIAHYDPLRYRFTTPEGVVFEFDQDFGVLQVIDANGNTLTFSAEGIQHSAGRSVAFHRDPQGRITQIIDPMGHTLAYTYDAAGDLVAFTDQEGLITRYQYDSTHKLVEIEDPRGLTAARNLYDDQGRLMAHLDAEGNRIEYTHNLAGREEIITDRLGNVTLFVYDDSGNILGESNALGDTTAFVYDSQDHELSRVDPLENIFSKTYDERGNVVTETDPQGNTVVKSYDTRNRLLTYTDARGYTTTHTYDGTGNLLTVVDPQGNVEMHVYDPRGHRIATTRKSGDILRDEYDASGNRVKSINTLGYEVSYTYDSNGNQLTETKTRTMEDGTQVLMTTQWVYDARDRVIQEIDALGNFIQNEYNSIGKLAATIDKNGNRTVYTYDARGSLVHTLYPDDTEVTATYDAHGNRISLTDQAGNTTTYLYDALNRLVGTVNPDGSISRQEFDAAGREIGRIDENGSHTAYGYDAWGRRTRSIDTLGHETRYTYDANGNQTSMTDANGQTTFYEYDALNRHIRTSFPDGTSLHMQYDALGRKIAETDQAGRTTTFTYDSADSLIKIVDPLGSATRYIYDEVGNKLTQTDANGHMTQWKYDHLGRVISRTLPLGMTETFTYDAPGNILTHTDFNGQNTTFSYDTLHRIQTKTFPDGSQVHYTYTPTGQRASVTDTRGVTSYKYDTRGRLIEVMQPDGMTIQYTFDAVGNRTAVITLSGTTTYTYDALNRLHTVTDATGGMTTYTYDRVGNRTSVSNPNNTVTHYSYDALNRLILLEHLRADASVMASYAYTYDNVGNRVFVEEASGRTVAYTYDFLDRLVEEEITGAQLGTTDITYTYDAVGNRFSKILDGTTTSYIYDANDRLIQEDVVVYTYDDNGNLVEQHDASGTTHLTYNTENRLVAIVSPSQTLQFAYDADGLRTQAVRDGVVTTFIVDTQPPLAQVLEERDSDGSLQARYIRGDDLIAQERHETMAYYHRDGLGSTRLLTDDTGAITDTYTYDAFGNMLESSGTTDNTFLFAGEQFEPLLKSYYLRSRYYQPTLGRFLTMDDFEGFEEEPRSLHKYLYAQANPVNMVDPSGFAATLVGTMTVSSTLSIFGQIATIAPATFLYNAGAAATILIAGAVAACALQSVTSAFTALGSGGDCDITNFNIFFTGNDIPWHTRHASEVIATSPNLATLHRSPPYSRSWIRRTQPCKGNRASLTLLSCDEYPFASTREGGSGNEVSLKLVPVWEQFIQGGKLGAFYALCKVKRAPRRGGLVDESESLFGVVPTMLIGTGWVCK